MLAVHGIAVARLAVAAFAWRPIATGLPGLAGLTRFTGLARLAFASIGRGAEGEALAGGGVVRSGGGFVCGEEAEAEGGCGFCVDVDCEDWGGGT